MQHTDENDQLEYSRGTNRDETPKDAHSSNTHSNVERSEEIGKKETCEQIIYIENEVDKEESYDVADEPEEEEEERKKKFISNLEVYANGKEGYISNYVRQVASELQHIVLNHVPFEKEVFSVGSGDGIFENYMVSAYGIQVTCIDPRDEKVFSQANQLSRTYHNELVMPPEYTFITKVPEERCVGATLLLVAPTPDSSSEPKIEYDVEAVLYPKEKPWGKIILIIDRSGGSGSTFLQQIVNLMDGCDYRFQFGVGGYTPRERYLENWSEYNEIAFAVAKKYQLSYIFNRDCGAFVYSIVVMDSKRGHQELESKYVRRKSQRQEEACALI